MSKQLRWKEDEWQELHDILDILLTGPRNAPECNWCWCRGIRKCRRKLRRITGRMPAGMRARGDKTGGRRKGQALMARPKKPISNHRKPWMAAIFKTAQKSVSLLKRDLR